MKSEPDASVTVQEVMQNPPIGIVQERVNHSENSRVFLETMPGEGAEKTGILGEVVKAQTDVVSSSPNIAIGAAVPLINVKSKIESEDSGQNSKYSSQQIFESENVEISGPNETAIRRSQGAPTIEKHKSTREWQIITTLARVDSSNQGQLMQEIEFLVKNNYQKVGIDLRATKFLSFPVIKSIADLSQEISKKGGVIVLIGCGERTRKHFDVYGTLDHVMLVRSPEELDGFEEETRIRLAGF